MSAQGEWKPPALAPPNPRLKHFYPVDTVPVPPPNDLSQASAAHAKAVRQRRRLSLHEQIARYFEGSFGTPPR